MYIHHRFLLPHKRLCCHLLLPQGSEYASVGAEQRARLAANFLAAMQQVHRLGVHGDVKPANIVASSSEDVRRGHPGLKVIDWDTGRTRVGLAARQWPNGPHNQNAVQPWVSDVGSVGDCFESISLWWANDSFCCPWVPI